MKIYRIIFAAVMVFCVHPTVFSQSDKKLPYKNAGLSIEERVKDLLQRMTIEEKFWQMFMIPEESDIQNISRYKKGLFGFQFSALSQIDNELAVKINKVQKYFVEQTRLGIPIIPFDEALHGLVRGGCTSFPQAIALAATWDTTLVGLVAEAIAKETKVRGIRQVLTPVINIATDVRWGRTEETYGEDPFLTAVMGVAFVSPFEKSGIITTPKHFIANVGEGGRDSYPISANERELEERHLFPFREVIEKGGARSVMTSYNSLNGDPCTSNDWLLNVKLKKEIGFRGLVISDAGATGGANVLHNTSPDYPTSGRQAITGGLDVIFQTDYDHHKLFIPPFLDNSIDMQIIDSAVSRILRAKFELGLFDNPYVTEVPEGVEDIMRHKKLARLAACESIVLLKNEKSTLPLTRNVRSIAVIGVDAVEARLGGYSGPGNGKVSILEGIKQRAGKNKNTEVFYAPGCGRKSELLTVVPDSCLSALTGEYFNNINLEGVPAFTRVDKKISFHWTLFSPDPRLPADFFSVRWTGKLKAFKTGYHQIGIDGNDGFRLYINGELLVDNWQKRTYSTLSSRYCFEKDNEYDIKVEFYESSGNASVNLVWDMGVEDDHRQKIKEAIAVAEKADVVTIVAGIQEGEFQDRAGLGLPGHQEELIRGIAETGKPVVVIIVGGSAVTMGTWIDKVDCILDVWYPGEEGGNAVADVLFGFYNPAGRLPVTFPVSEAQLPLVYNHKPTGRGDDYNNLTGLPLFPFGYGLSYTKFEYGDLCFDKDTILGSESVDVRFKLKNSGDREGDEVVQLYIRDILASVARPVMELKGFQRVHLLPGEVKEVAFKITPAMLSMLDRELKRVVEPGDFRIMIGSSSRELRLKGNLRVR